MQITAKNDRKKELFMRSIAEMKTLEPHFSRMAAKGWLIDKIGMYYCEYKKTEPQELQFCVDILPQITAFDYPENDSVQEYRRICGESGWTFAASSKQLQVFYSENKNDMPIPIHTDNKIEARNILKICGKYELPFLLIGLISLWFAWGSIIGKGYELFLSNISLAQAVSSVVITLPIIWYCGFTFLWILRTLIRMKRNLPVPKASNSWAGARGACLGISAITAVLMLFTGIILEIINGMPVILGVITFFPMLSFIIGLFIRKRIDTKKSSKASNIGMFAAVMVVIVVIYIAVMAFAINHLGASLSETEHLPDNKMALRLTDIGVETLPQHYNYWGSGSIAVPLNYNYYESNSDGSVGTKIIKSISKRLTQGIFQAMLENEKEKEWLAVIEMESYEVKEWGAIRGYYHGENKNNLLLLYDKTILQIDYIGNNIQLDTIQKKAEMMGK